MDGLLMTVAILVAVAVAFTARRRRNARRGPEQTTEPPGERTAPDEWPRDGGDNPSAP